MTTTIGAAQLVIDRDELVRALRLAQDVADTRSTLPVLANVLLESAPEGLAIVATDLETGLRGLYKATALGCGSLALPARTLYDVARTLPPGDVRLIADGSNAMMVQAGCSRFRIAGLPSEDYPALPAIEREELTPLAGADILELIRKTVFAAADHDTDTLYALHAVLVTLTRTGGKTVLRLVAADRYRLAVAERPIGESAGADAPKHIEAIVPKKAVQVLRRLLEEGGDEEPSIGFTKNQMIVRKGRLLLSSRLVEGNYPAYRRVIPKESDRRVAVNRGALDRALRRVAVMAEDPTNAVGLVVEPGRIVLHAHDRASGEATEEVEASYQGEPLTTGFNVRYLLEVLGVMDGEIVTLQMETPRGPCLIQEPETPGFRYVVMPVQLNQ